MKMEDLKGSVMQTGRPESLIRQLFTKWRSNVRDVIQKLQRNSAGLPVAPHTAATGPGMPPSKVIDLSEQPIKDADPCPGENLR